MARQIELQEQQAVVHGGVAPVPFNVFAYSLSDAICRIGIPSLEIGLAAASSGLVKLTKGEGTPHFEWDKAKLDRHSPIFLENLLLNLRTAAGVEQ